MSFVDKKNKVKILLIDISVIYIMESMVFVNIAERK